MNTIPNRKDRMEQRLRQAILGIRSHLHIRADQNLIDKYVECATRNLAQTGEAQLPTLHPHENPSRLWVVASEIDKTIRAFWGYCDTGIKPELADVGIDRLEQYAQKGWSHLTIAGDIASGYRLE